MNLSHYFRLGALVPALLSATAWAAQDDAMPEKSTRLEAAKILKESLDTAPTEGNRLQGYLDAGRRAVELLGPDSEVARQLAATLDSVTETEKPEAEAALRAILKATCETLQFQPLLEASLPEDFPDPTPVGEIIVKRYPAYRMAEVGMDEGRAFWTLFGHIKRNNIAMTAPVQMGYRAKEENAPKQDSMAFLYGKAELGTPGEEGKVTIKDVPAMTVVSLGLRGGRTPDKVAEARKRLLVWLDEHADRYAPAGEIRVMGYNSPFVFGNRRFFEVEIPIEEKP